ncbi:glycosyltransferase family 39 protein [Rubripirellula sp.]|nr:glycosyltransferase family 39 protein [Rubripirellula sp.]MDB4338542.1 glycosyltransferase family 39 protein [Rubripirellula sp.]
MRWNDMESNQNETRIALIAAAVIMVISILLRAPSCYESLWVDELHSAWSVWGSLSEVLGRAQAGHQMPIYFWGLWFWKSLFGISEFALRFSSVLPVSLACALLAYGFARLRYGVIAGMAAGLTLAVEQNSIFFGTELRPYGWVIFFSAVTHLCFLSLLRTNSRLASQNIWSSMLASILVAAFLQPTSIGTLFVYPLILLCHWNRRKHELRVKPKITLGDLAWLLGGLGSVALIWQLSLAESWGQRGIWSAFGQSTSLEEILHAWNWWWLWAIPLTFVIIIMITIKLRDRPECCPMEMKALIYLASICLIVTLLYWLVAYKPIAPVWHRRYFIALLPGFACLTGLSVTAIKSNLINSRWLIISQRSNLLVSLTASFFVIGLAWDQNLLRRLHRYPVAYATRGEHWREAANWINENVDRDQILWLAPGLIEEESLNQLPNSLPQRDPQNEPFLTKHAKLKEYLKYPLHGPYQTRQNIRLWMQRKNVSGGYQNTNRSKNDDDQVEILLIRKPKRSLKEFSTDNQSVISFGNLSLVLFDHQKTKSPVSE